MLLPIDSSSIPPSEMDSIITIARDVFLRFLCLKTFLWADKYPVEPPKTNHIDMLLLLSKDGALFKITFFLQGRVRTSPSRFVHFSFSTYRGFKDFKKRKYQKTWRRGFAGRWRRIVFVLLFFFCYCPCSMFFTYPFSSSFFSRSLISLI